MDLWSEYESPLPQHYPRSDRRVSLRSLNKSHLSYTFLSSFNCVKFFDKEFHLILHQGKEFLL